MSISQLRFAVEAIWEREGKSRGVAGRRENVEMRVVFEGEGEGVVDGGDGEGEGEGMGFMAGGGMLDEGWCKVVVEIGSKVVVEGGFEMVVEAGSEEGFICGRVW